MVLGSGDGVALLSLSGAGKHDKCVVQNCGINLCIL